MMVKRQLLGVLACLVLMAYGPAARADEVSSEQMPLIVDVQADLLRLNLAPRNAAGDSETDDSEVIQTAIDRLAEQGGGTLTFGPGVYRVSGLVVRPGVRIVGASREETIFRAWEAATMFTLHGGELHNFTAYGTRTPADSENWTPGKGGTGRGGTARALMVIQVGNSHENIIAENSVISNVTAKEARYDCLYTRGSRGLRVINCEFDRAGRNVVSMVGSDQDFLFANCRFGSLWGLYHVDVEPNKGRAVRDGLFVNCVFDGRQAGERGTDTWGAMLIFSGHEAVENRNIAVVGCRFLDIAVRVRGVFPDAQFLYNPEMDGTGSMFVKVRTNPVGEFRDAAVRGNRFVQDGKPATRIIAGAKFTGSSVFEQNHPAQFNGLKPQAAGDQTHWEEDHPVAQPQSQRQGGDGAARSADDAKTVTMPLMGHRFRFRDAAVLGYREEGSADVSFHADPLMAEGKARIQLLGRGRLEDFKGGPASQGYVEMLWGPAVGQVAAVRTQDGPTVLLEILELKPQEITFRYRALPALPADGAAPAAQR